MYHGHPSDYFAELATTRVKEKDTQDECLLFKLAAETRNEIYALVFPVGPKKDGGIELNNHSAEDALTRTCQQIYDESQKMYKRAKRIYPTYTFTINVVDRKEPLVNALALEGFDFLELTSFCVTGEPTNTTKATHSASPRASRNVSVSAITGI
jgi:hypothetical protein